MILSYQHYLSKTWLIISFKVLAFVLEKVSIFRYRFHHIFPNTAQTIFIVILPFFRITIFPLMVIWSTILEFIQSSRILSHLVKSPSSVFLIHLSLCLVFALESIVVWLEVSVLILLQNSAKLLLKVLLVYFRLVWWFICAPILFWWAWRWPRTSRTRSWSLSSLLVSRSASLFLFWVTSASVSVFMLALFAFLALFLLFVFLTFLLLSF